MEYAPEHIEEIIAHARADAPDEVCGLVAGRDGRSERVFRMENAAHSPLRFEVEPLEVMRTLEEIDGAGLEVGGLYHSHTRTDPYPLADRRDVRRGLAGDAVDHRRARWRRAHRADLSDRGA